MKLIKVINGVRLFVDEATESMEEYAHEKGLLNYRVFIVESKDGIKTYALYDGHGIPEYVNQRMEDICCHIDILHVADTWL